MRYTEIKNLENEEWRPIEGFDGRYYVSNYGRVKSHLRHGYNQIPCEAYAHLLTPVILKIGYPSVVLWKKGKPTTNYIHRLVAAAFIGKLLQGMVVNHKDGCKTNNHVTNLEIITQSGNRSHAVRTGLLKGSVNPPRAIAVLKDGQEVGRFESLADAAKVMGLRVQNISQVLRGEKKSHRGYTFKYL